MSPYETASVVISVIALVVSIVSLIKANSLAAGNIELYINERITATKEKVGDIAMQMDVLSTKQDKTPEEERLLKTYSHIFSTSVENNLNAYEEACAKYLDKKVDKKRFEKTHKTEIRQLVENPEFKEYFDSVTSRYRAILKVFTHWENLE